MMEIMRVVRDLVTTKRNFWLAAKSLRVVEDHQGNLQVALDPVGCKPGDFVITIGISAARIAAGNPNITTDMTIGGIIDEWSEREWRS
jgi:ethanolamine utilization protein EutN